MIIRFHYTYIILAISFIIIGYFSNILVFTSIIIIHELGHYLIAKIVKLNPQEITIYPFGGITKMVHPINSPIIKELIVSISGIIFQLLYFLITYIFYNKGIIREYIFNEFITYNKSILLFNILPIHPLDGSVFLCLLLQKIFPYKTTLKLNIILSILTSIYLLMINYYKFNYTTILIISVIMTNIVKYYKSINYNFNKFLLERYLYKLHFKKTKNISKITKMYKEKYHIIKEKNNYLTEKQLLNRRFKEK